VSVWVITCSGEDWHDHTFRILLSGLWVMIVWLCSLRGHGISTEFWWDTT
jgi:hypothetical protein